MLQKKFFWKTEEESHEICTGDIFKERTKLPDLLTLGWWVVSIYWLPTICWIAEAITEQVSNYFLVRKKVSSLYEFYLRN